jgi:hypothetical protein
MITPHDLPPGLYRRGRLYWVKYYRGGLPMRESTGTAKLSAAKRFLDERKGRVATGAPILPRADKVRYEEAAGDLQRHYATTGRRNLREAKARFAHLQRFFAGYRIATIGPADRNPLRRRAAGRRRRQRHDQPRTGHAAADAAAGVRAQQAPAAAHPALAGRGAGPGGLLRARPVRGRCAGISPRISRRP